MLIGDIPKRNAKFYPEDIAVIDGETEFTFSKFNKRVNRLANAIIDMDTKKGDRIAALSQNRYQYMELYFASAKAGRPIVPLNYRFKEREMKHVIEDSDPQILFFEEEQYPLIENLELDLNRQVCIDEDLSEVEFYEDILDEYSAEEPEVSLDEDDVAIHNYTGGTTGLPKGVLTTHRNVISSCFNLCAENSPKTGPEQIYLNAPPVFHSGDAMGMFTYSFTGGTNVMMKYTDAADPLKYIEKHDVTCALLVPTMIIWMLKVPNIDEYDLDSLETIIYGTAPMPLEPLKKAQKVLDCNFAQIYGATETYVPMCVLKSEDHVVEGSEEEIRKMKSAGREILGVEAKIVDTNGDEVEKGEVGEILVRGDNVMKGYWKKPDLTEETLEDGWYHTGDLGKRDEENYIYIVDRKKDMIVSGGENIYPKEIENVLHDHPAVVEAAVIGVPDEEWGEAVKAFVITEEDIGENELLEFCDEHLSDYKKPKSIEFPDEIPKSSVGKIQKHKLREPYWEDKERKV